MSSQSPEVRLITSKRLPLPTSHLVAAIEAEALGDFASALEHYRRLVETGPPLDRIGIYQALARCGEKLGHLGDAGAWRRKAGQGYLVLEDETMKPEEREYLALVEYRNAVQDLHDDPSLGDVAKEYAAVLKRNFSEGAEGLTHEGLFAGAFFRAQGEHLLAAKYLVDTAEVLSEQATAHGGRVEREAAIRAYELAVDSATKAGRPDVARVAQMRAYDLKQIP